MSLNTPFISVVVPIPIHNNREFVYKIPEHLLSRVIPGKRVFVPFGRRVITGYAVGFKKESDAKGIEIKEIIDCLDDEPIFDEAGLMFYRWMSSYYFSSLGEVLKLTHPPALNIREKRYFSITDRGREYLGLDKDRKACGILKFIAGKKTASLSSITRGLKINSPYNIIERLKKEGLIVEESKVKGFREKTERFISLLPPAKEFQTKYALEILKRKSPIQARVVLFLLDRGETSLSVLRKELGKVDNAIKKLASKGIIGISEKIVELDPLEIFEGEPSTVPYKPNIEQSSAISLIKDAVKSQRFSPFLLHGVTGSGKTLVYLNAIEECLKLGKNAIVLVPEISLAYGIARHIVRRFSKRVALQHSGLSMFERCSQWRRIKDDKVDIVLGARSALFAPLKDVGLIIVDEEHDASYKQDDGVRYNARDGGIMMAKFMDAAVVLGSATPAIETFYNARTGKIRLLSMNKRVEDRPMPDVEIVDMRQEFKIQNPKSKIQNIISERLKNLLEDALNKKQQAIILLNRRGFSNFIVCRDCGYIFKCLNCSVSMTFHKTGNILKCHYCGLSMSLPDACPGCNGYGLNDIGAGTQKLEHEIRRLFPKARIARMDMDTTRKKRSHEKIMNAVERGEADILIGTQMVAKGLHFPNVTLMGIISGDASMNIPDFRGVERAFQLMMQAAGRAGRDFLPGRVVIQTFNPEHYCFKGIMNHDYVRFFDEEIGVRKDAIYPPFCRLINMRLEGNSEKRVAEGAGILKRIADRNVKGFDNIIILGPAPAFLSLLRGKHRWQMLVKGKDVKALHRFVNYTADEFIDKKMRGVELIVDVDPGATI